jgi:hypothetical protein
MPWLLIPLLPIPVEYIKHRNNVSSFSSPLSLFSVALVRAEKRIAMQPTSLLPLLTCVRVSTVVDPAISKTCTVHGEQCQFVFHTLFSVALARIEKLIAMHPTSCLPLLTGVPDSIIVEADVVKSIIGVGREDRGWREKEGGAKSIIGVGRDDRGWREKEGGGGGEGRVLEDKKLAKWWDETGTGCYTGLVPAAIFGLDVVFEIFIHNGFRNSLDRRNKQDSEQESASEDQNTSTSTSTNRDQRLCPVWLS